MEITRETVIGDIVDFDPETAEVFMDCGMHCIECPVSRLESIEEACEVHGVDPDELIENLKDYFEHKNEKTDK
jgi:hybrid cluster-associated redox disulfide protein